MSNDLGCAFAVVCWFLIFWKILDIVMWFFSHLAWV